MLIYLADAVGVHAATSDGTTRGGGRLNEDAGGGARAAAGPMGERGTGTARPAVGAVVLVAMMSALR